MSIFVSQKIVPGRNINFLVRENRSVRNVNFCFTKKSVRTPYLSLPTKYRIVHSVVAVVIVIHRSYRFSVFPNPFKHEDFTSVT